MMSSHDWRLNSRDAQVQTEMCRGCGCMRVTSFKENPPRVQFITPWGETCQALDARCLRTAPKSPSA